MHHFMLQVTLSLTFHQHHCFLKAAGGYHHKWPSKFNSTFFSHTDLLLQTSCPLNIYFLVGPPTLTLQCIRLTESELIPPGWPLLKLWIWWHCVILIRFFYFWHDCAKNSITQSIMFQIYIFFPDDRKHMLIIKSEFLTILSKNWSNVNVSKVGAFFFASPDIW